MKMQTGNRSKSRYALKRRSISSQQVPAAAGLNPETLRDLHALLIVFA